VYVNNPNGDLSYFRMSVLSALSRLKHPCVIALLICLNLFNFLSLFSWNNGKTEIITPMQVTRVFNAPANSKYSLLRKLDTVPRTDLITKRPSNHNENITIAVRLGAANIDGLRSINASRDVATKLEKLNGRGEIDRNAGVGIKKILAWTPLTAKKPLWGIKPWSFMKCEYKNCMATGNRSELDTSDLVLFRVSGLKPDYTKEPLRAYVRPFDVTDLPERHTAGQMWIYINQVSELLASY